MNSSETSRFAGTSYRAVMIVDTQKVAKNVTLSQKARSTGKDLPWVKEAQETLWKTMSRDGSGERR